MQPILALRHLRPLLGAGAVSLLLTVPAVAAEGLVSAKASGAVALDGEVDAAWSQAAPIKVTLDKLPYKSDAYPGATTTEVTLRSVYDAEHVYFLIQYKDPARSLARQPWVKQEDGSWKQAAKPDSTGNENTFYEDQLAFVWDINTKGFPKLGCAVVCHTSVGGKVGGIEDPAPGRKYTNRPGEVTDLWLWRGIQGGAVAQVDDQFINDNKPADAAHWGRRSDDGEGGYVANVNEAKNGPAFMPAKIEADKPWITDAEKAPFADTFKAGDSIPSVIVKPATGSRADVACGAKWADGVWTIEIKRKLVTTGEQAAVQDVQFSDLTKTYPFGIAVFDNAQTDHLYHGGSLKLTFTP